MLRGKWNSEGTLARLSPSTTNFLGEEELSDVSRLWDLLPMGPLLGPVDIRLLLRRKVSALRNTIAGSAFIRLWATTSMSCRK